MFSCPRLVGQGFTRAGRSRGHPETSPSPGVEITGSSPFRPRRRLPIRSILSPPPWGSTRAWPGSPLCRTVRSLSRLTASASWKAQPCQGAAQASWKSQIFSPTGTNRSPVLPGLRPGLPIAATAMEGRGSGRRHGGRRAATAMEGRGSGRAGRVSLWRERKHPICSGNTAEDLCNRCRK